MSASLSRWASLAGASVVVAGAIAGSVLAADPEPRPSPQPSSGWQDGAEVYAKVCAHCHETGVGPTLGGRGLPAEYFKVFVRNGSRAMPAFRASEIDDTALARLAEHLAKQ